MKEQIKAGLIGCGHLGNYHAKIYFQKKDINFVGVYDSNKKSALNLASKYKCKVFDNSESLLDEVDIVTVATPATTHYEVIKESLENNCHVLAEKPIASSVKDAEKLAKLSKKKGLILCVGHVERFNPAYRKLVEEKPNPSFIEVHRLSSFGERGIDVDVILDIMIHDIDLVLNIIDSKLSSVHASGVAVASNSIDIANARLVFKNGCTANLTASRISPKQMRKFRVFQQGFSYSLDLAKPEITIFEVKGKKKDILHKKPILAKTNPLYDEISTFIESVIEKKYTGFIASPIDGTMALKVAEKIRRCCKK